MPERGDSYLLCVIKIKMPEREGKKREGKKNGKEGRGCKYVGDMGVVLGGREMV